MKIRIPVSFHLMRKFVFASLIAMLFLLAASLQILAATYSVSQNTNPVTSLNASRNLEEATPTPFGPASPIYIPVLIKQGSPTPPPTTPPPVEDPETVLFCSSPGLNIPDDDASGVSDTIQIDDPRLILDLNVSLDIEHTWVGDLSVSLTHQETGVASTLIHRPGIPQYAESCGGNDIRAILDDDLSLPVEDQCSSSYPAISGIFLPNEPVKIFNQESISGSWTLNVADHYRADTGKLNKWCLEANIAAAIPEPDPGPEIGSLPAQASIGPIYGQSQLLPLDCETRSAVDWAGYFGKRINELNFFNSLPASDNPDEGFVGDVNGTWGQIPPYDYGVHAEPIAEKLQEYGLEAYAHRPLSWEMLRYEIASGRPVIVWIVGSVNNGIPEYYTSSDGHLTVVARHEHTVVVTGYDQNNVYYLNGGGIYSRTIEEFLSSWSAMRNMAVTARP